MMMTFITQGGEGLGKTKEKRKATKSKGRGLFDLRSPSVQIAKALESRGYRLPSGGAKRRGSKLPKYPPALRSRGQRLLPRAGKARRQHEKRRKRRRGGLLIQAGSEAERGLPIQAGREAERGVLRAPEKGFQGRVGRARVLSKARRVADVGEGVPASRSRTARVVGKSIVARGALLPVTKLASKCHGCVQP